jgi:hypothetical protein
MQIAKLPVKLRSVPELFRVSGRPNSPPQNCSLTTLLVLDPSCELHFRAMEWHERAKCLPNAFQQVFVPLLAAASRKVHYQWD